MPTLEVQPRPTPEERHDAAVEVEVDEELTVHAATIEDWVAPRQSWEFTLHEGHDFGRANNVEARLLFVAGEQTSSLVFRLAFDLQFLLGGVSSRPVNLARMHAKARAERTGS